MESGWYALTGKVYDEQNSIDQVKSADEILHELREILGVPEGESILEFAEEIVNHLDLYDPFWKNFR